MKKRWKILIIFLILIAVGGGGFYLRWKHVHRFDHLYWLNRRSGTVHNSGCKWHFKGHEPEEYITQEEVRHPRLKDCQICGGRNKKRSEKKKSPIR